MSLCSCDPEKTRDLDCFEHGHSNKILNKLDRLSQENEDLRHELKMLQSGAIRLSQECAEYREALEKVIDYKLKSTDGLTDFGISWDRGHAIGSMRDLCREALSKGEEIRGEK